MQAHYQTLAALRQGLFVVRADVPEQPITFVNPAFTELTGYAADAAVGRRCDALFTGREGDEACRLLAEAADSGNTGQHLQDRHADRSGFFILVSVSLICDQSGRYYVAQIERANGRTAPGTEARSSVQRPAQLSEPAAAVVETGEFISRIAHELRTPLSACLAWMTLLEMQAEGSPEMTKATEAIRRNLDRQTRLIGNLVDVTQISTGGIEVFPEPLELGTLVAALVDDWQSAAAAHKVTLEYQPADAECPVFADPDRITQVVSNLIESALIAASDNAKTIVRIERQRDRAQVTVCHIGASLSADDANWMLALPDRERRDAQDYTGLGMRLAVAAHLVRNHQGSIRAMGPDSEEGCTFVVELPMS